MSGATNGTVAPAAPNTSNGTQAPATQQQSATAPDLATVLKERDEYRQKVEAANNKLRTNHIEVMKFQEERKKFQDEKKGLGFKLSEHSAFESAFKAAGLTPGDLRNFKLNPTAVLQKALGDNWYDKVVEMRINGGAPTADTVAAEIARAKDEWRAEMEAKEKEREEGGRKARQEAEAAARAQLAQEASDFMSQAAAEYPLLSGFKSDVLAKAVAQYQEQEFHRTGKVLTSKEACDAMEWAQVSHRLLNEQDVPEKALEKYSERLGKLTGRLKPASVAPVVGSRGAPNTQQAERRTLSNDLSASTPGTKRTPRTDEERRAAIMALDLGGLRKP